MPRNDLKSIGLAIARAAKEGRSRDHGEFWEQFVAQLELRLRSIESAGTGTTEVQTAIRTTIIQSSAKVPDGIVYDPMANAVAGLKQPVFSRPVTNEPDGIYKLRKVKAAAGEGIVSGNGIAIYDNLAYLTDATVTARSCSGVCIVAPDINGELYYRAGGELVAILAQEATTKGPVYTSSTPGQFTDVIELDAPFAHPVGWWRGPVYSDLGATNLFLLELTPSPMAVVGEWSVLTNGLAASPELVFAAGDVIMVYEPVGA